MNTKRALISIALFALYASIIALIFGRNASTSTGAVYFFTEFLLWTPLLLGAQFLLFATGKSVLSHWYIYPITGWFFSRFFLPTRVLEWEAQSATQERLLIAAGYFAAYVLTLSALSLIGHLTKKRPSTWGGALIITMATIAAIAWGVVMQEAAKPPARDPNAPYVIDQGIPN